MSNEQLTYFHIQRALKRRNFKVNHSHERLIKRIKTSIDDLKRQKESITTIVNFPNELFYQIFSYLTDGKLFSSFHLLTKDDRFDELIRTRTSINLQSIRRLHSTLIN